MDRTNNTNDDARFKYSLYDFQEKEKEQSSVKNIMSFNFIYSFEHTPYKELEPAEQDES
jgi:hypothetical protein